MMNTGALTFPLQFFVTSRKAALNSRGAGNLGATTNAAWCSVAHGEIARIPERCLVMSVNMDAGIEYTHDD